MIHISKSILSDLNKLLVRTLKVIKTNVKYSRAKVNWTSCRITEARSLRFVGFSRMHPCWNCIVRKHMFSSVGVRERVNERRRTRRTKKNGRAAAVWQPVWHHLDEEHAPFTPTERFGGEERGVECLSLWISMQRTYCGREAAPSNGVSP